MTLETYAFLALLREDAGARRAKIISSGIRGQLVIVVEGAGPEVVERACLQLGLEPVWLTVPEDTKLVGCRVKGPLTTGEWYFEEEGLAQA